MWLAKRPKLAFCGISDTLLISLVTAASDSQQDQRECACAEQMARSRA